MFDLPEYNALYEKAKRMPPGPERDALYTRMVKLIMVYMPWMVETYKAQTVLMQPWLLGYKKHPFAVEPWKYLDIDLAREGADRR
jgi:ABC-type transport system substrate-binding protein